MIWVYLVLLFSRTIRTTGAEARPDVEIRLDLDSRFPVSSTLYGIFFEEINHAGEGGLYAELIQDRSFDALAATSGFNEDQASIDLSEAHFQAPPEPKTLLPALEDLKQIAKGPVNGSHPYHSLNGLYQPVSWRPSDSARTALTRQEPLHPYNKVALQLTTSVPYTGIANTGFWGVPINGGWIYRFSIYIKGSKDAKVRILFRSQDTLRVYADTTFDGITDSWQKFSANLTSNTTDFKAEVAVELEEPGTVLIDSLSLFPGGNIKPGWLNPYPFREDMLQLLKDLNPRFLRFPGGCYVEGGDWLKNRFPWRTNIGLYEHRTGHLNDNWGYWSTDGLGLYEYMLLAEELQAEPVYVINNGVSHQESVPVAQIAPFIQETLEALEFISGSNDTKWGAFRANMGRKEPWKINYLAIGNEDCGKPWYVENYNAFYTALKAKYPHLTLIANCDLGSAAPVDLWDWHTYDSAEVMFNRMHQFDGLKRGVDPPVFVSEYAVTVDGGWGNVKGAVAEASFMTGMERNSDIIKLASYAPLFVHTENRVWPTNMIVFDNHRTYRTPSYLVQQLFSRFQGKEVVHSDVVFSDDVVQKGQPVAASATFQDSNRERLAVKASNFNTLAQNVTIKFSSKQEIALEDKATLYYVSGDPEAENSFDDSETVVIREEAISLGGKQHGEHYHIQIELPRWSASALELTLKPKPS